MKSFKEFIKEKIYNCNTELDLGTVLTTLEWLDEYMELQSKVNKK
jgi:hypothetical protein